VPEEVRWTVRTGCARLQLECEPCLGATLECVRVLHALRGNSHVVVGRDISEGGRVHAICRYVVERRNITERGEPCANGRLRVWESVEFEWRNEERDRRADWTAWYPSYAPVGGGKAREHARSSPAVKCIVSQATDDIRIIRINIRHSPLAIRNYLTVSANASRPPCSCTSSHYTLRAIVMCSHKR
jgi:hypothetical protein